MGIRRVYHGQFMLCPKCGTLYLVSDLVGGATVWHRSCEKSLELQLDVCDYESCVLCMVVLDRDNNRLEIRPGLGRLD